MDTHLLRTKVIYSNLEQFVNNHEFECKVWKNTEATAKHVVIMFNGFLEGIGDHNNQY